jgi:3-phenylpropionate/trans-cinnamate dioxygenase ferredoxin subunit
VNKTWINVALVKDFSPGTWQVVALENRTILVVNVEGEFFAIEDLCTHDGGVLSEGGELKGNEFVCPRHGARFCVKTGQVTAPPAYEDIQTFSVRVENGMVQLLG